MKYLVFILSTAISFSTMASDFACEFRDGSAYIYGSHLQISFDNGTKIETDVKKLSETKNYGSEAPWDNSAMQIKTKYVDASGAYFLRLETTVKYDETGNIVGKSLIIGEDGGRINTCEI